MEYNEYNENKNGRQSLQNTDELNEEIIDISNNIKRKNSKTIVRTE